jgi:hypothetical protein
MLLLHLSDDRIFRTTVSFGPTKKIFVGAPIRTRAVIRTLTPNRCCHNVCFDIRIRINMMMKTAVILLATLSLAQVQAQTLRTNIVDFPEDMSMNPDYQFLKELGISPELEFELMVKNGIDPRDGVIDVDSFSGEVELSELDFDVEEGGDRQEFLLNLCGAIENLFSGTVFCTCNNPLLQLGVISFDCDYMRDFTVAGLTFTPSYFGIFQFRVFALAISFRDGICMDDLNVFVEGVGDVNLGDFCLAIDVVAGFSPGNGFQVRIEECVVQAGFLFSCASCSPCPLPNGGLGVALICDIATTVPCIPISIPFVRDTGLGKVGGLIKGNEFFDYFDLKPAVNQLIADKQAEQQAAQDAQDAADQAAQDAQDNNNGGGGGGDNCDGKGKGKGKHADCADDEPAAVDEPAPPASSPTDEEDDGPSRYAPPLTTTPWEKLRCRLFGC